MKSTYSRVCLVVPLLAGLWLAAPACAAPAAGTSDISQQQAVAIAQQVHPGRVLAVKHRGTTYRVKLLNASGEVRSIVIDAQSGRVISGR